MTVDRLTLRRLQVPLSVPYKLAFGPVTAFDMILAEAVDADGKTGWGEATILTGYTDETIEGAWAAVCGKAPELIGQPADEGKRRAGALHAKTPFAGTALVTALEMLAGHACLSPAVEQRMRLLAIVNGSEPEAYGPEIEDRLSEGFGTLKVKAGFDVEADLTRIADIQKRVAGRAIIRLDANQGYDAAEGVRFVSGLDPVGIELVEQTCAAGDWDAAVTVSKAARRTGVPMMLDESIYGADDIDRAADLNCADFIKLKLMKAGGLDDLVAGLMKIGERGMTAVLGNGVAGDIGCWMEVCAAAEVVKTAGEMNGFLKPTTQLFDLPLRLQEGDLIIGPGGTVVPDRDAIETFTLEHKTFE